MSEQCRGSHGSRVCRHLSDAIFADRRRMSGVIVDNGKPLCSGTVSDGERLWERAVSASARSRRSALDRRRARAGIAFVAPNLAAVTLFLLFPLGFSLYLSFHSWDLFGPMRFAGLANYGQLLGDPLFAIALRNTAVFTALTLAPTMLISLVVAAALNRKCKGIAVFRTAAF